MSTVSEATEVVNGLNAIGDIKQKMHVLERLKDQIEDQMMLDEREQVRLTEYKQELEKLQEEKLAHVAELRLIHSDIDVMEGTIKQAETERGRNIGQLHSLYAQYVPMLTQINFLRLSLGLSCLQDETLHVKLNNETLSKLKEFEAEQRSTGQTVLSLFSSDLQRQLAANSALQASVTGNANYGGEEDNGAVQNTAATDNAETRWKHESAASPRTQSASAYDAESASRSVSALMAGNASQNNAKAAAFNALPLSNVTQLMQPASSVTSLNDSALPVQVPVPVPFASNSAGNPPLSLQTAASLCRMIRQQTPPMKACSSCQQQIHRNAPICPLCKARSRSQHSKRASAAKRSKPPQ